VPGIDAIFVGPNDLAYSMRSADGAMPSKELFEGTLARILQAAQRHRVPCGLHVLTTEDALRRARQGFQFIAVGSELKFMLDGSADAVRQINPGAEEEDLAKY
jgi:4-hydroxy-2-oxoheptanedioate aldolase